MFPALVEIFRPILLEASKSKGVIRLKNGGRLDFWTLGNAIAGRGRRYHRIVIDEAAFTKDGDNTLDDSMMGLWEKAIKPTLFDFNGEALVCSNSNGKNPDNFFYCQSAFKRDPGSASKRDPPEGRVLTSAHPPSELFGRLTIRAAAGSVGM